MITSQTVINLNVSSILSLKCVREVGGVYAIMNQLQIEMLDFKQTFLQTPIKMDTVDNNIKYSVYVILCVTNSTNHLPMSPTMIAPQTDWCYLYKCELDTVMGVRSGSGECTLLWTNDKIEITLKYVSLLELNSGAFEYEISKEYYAKDTECEIRIQSRFKVNKAYYPKGFSHEQNSE